VCQIGGISPIFSIFSSRSSALELDWQVIVSIASISFEIPLEANEEGEDAYLSDDQVGAPISIGNHQPKNEDEGDQEEHCSHHIHELLQSVEMQIEEVEQEDDDVEHDEHEVQPACETNAPFPEA